MIGSESGKPLARRVVQTHGPEVFSVLAVFKRYVYNEAIVLVYMI